MKKVLKIIVPLLLIAVLIGGSIWYLFAYDRTFTQDVLLHTARFFDDRGNATIAQGFYNMAYKLGKDTDAVAIELAHQYIDDGNYTKAEYTLYNAINDGAGVSVYEALSKVYVDQGKLLDALLLAEQAPQNIRQQLAARRPALPVADRPSGELEDYGPISISGNGKLYVTTDNAVPSVRKDQYKGPITLVAGSNTIRAVVVNELGLVSEATFNYTVHGVIEPVVFTDFAFEQEIRRLLAAETPNASVDIAEGKAPIFEGSRFEKDIQKMLNAEDNIALTEPDVTEQPLFEGTVYTNQLWDIITFTMPEDAASYEDLKYLINLQELTIRNGRKDQLACLSNHPELEKLNLTGTPVSDEELTVIGTLRNLNTLKLGKCGITTVAPIAELTKLEVLDLQHNTILDLSPLSNMTNLTKLFLNNNAINDISVLERFTKLTHLDISRNDINSIEPVFKLTNLTLLYAASQGKDEEGGLTSIDGIQALTNLTRLSLANNKLSDVDMLVACTKLKYLDISQNDITSIDILQSNNALRALNFSYNSVSTIPHWDHDLSQLSIIDGSNNKISSIEPLAGHHLINKINMDNNEEIEDVNALITCHALMLVSVDGTNVKEADDLLWYYPSEDSPPYATGIVVLFDPTKEEN